MFLGSIFEPCYIKNRVITNHVIKRLSCIFYIENVHVLCVLYVEFSFQSRNLNDFSPVLDELQTNI